MADSLWEQWRALVVPNMGLIEIGMTFFLVIGFVSTRSGRPIANSRKIALNAKRRRRTHPRKINGPTGACDRAA